MVKLVGFYGVFYKYMYFFFFIGSDVSVLLNKHIYIMNSVMAFDMVPGQLIYNV